MTDARCWVLFAGNDSAYFAWISSHPTGYVLNIRRQDDLKYVVLHRASCRTVNPARAGTEPGAFTERSYRKVCSDSIESLRTWARQYGRSDGSFSKCCSICDPE